MKVAAGISIVGGGEETGMFEHVKFPHQKELLKQDFKAFGELALDWTSVSDASGGSNLGTDAVMLVEIDFRH